MGFTHLFGGRRGGKETFRAAAVAAVEEVKTMAPEYRRERFIEMMRRSYPMSVDVAGSLFDHYYGPFLDRTDPPQRLLAERLPLISGEPGQIIRYHATAPTSGTIAEVRCGHCGVKTAWTHNPGAIVMQCGACGAAL